MGEIINTGLGWWANEDWLRNVPGHIGQISNPSGGALLIAPRLNNDQPTGLEIVEYGTITGEDTAGTVYSYFGVLPGSTSTIVKYACAAVGTGYRVYCVSTAWFRTQQVSVNKSTGTPGTPSSPKTPSQRPDGYWYLNVGFAFERDSQIDPDIPRFNSLDDLVEAYDDIPETDFYKLANGYSICCFMRWLNANQQELVAPILVSTDSNYVPISVDGTTPASGLVTGIEFGGMTFYVNILLGYNGNVTSSVPYMDITSTFPSGINITELFRAIATFAQIRFTDPYAAGGTSEPGGGGGTFDLDSDNIPIPSLPTLSFASTGFTRIYNPTLSELNSLANYLWTDTTFLNTVINHLKQLLENPMDAIISLALLPCSIPNGTPEAVKVMYINTGVSMAPATTQFVDVDCGTYTLQEFYGSALDYNPYTKVHCYLPYIGQVTLDADEVMGKTIHVKYRIDIVTGMCAVLISVNRSGGMDESVLYQFSGHCSINMPINSADFSGYIGAAMTAGKMVAGVVAGAAGAPALAAELIGAPAPHSSTSETSKKTTVRNPKTGRQVTSGTTTRTTTHSTPGASFGEMTRKAAANTVGAVMGSKLTVEHAGGFTGNSGYLAVRRPYLIIERPRMCNPQEYGKYNGRPSMIYMSLSECSGYTEVQSIQFEDIPATNPELSELSELLKSGVIF